MNNLIIENKKSQISKDADIDFLHVLFSFIIGALALIVALSYSELSKTVIQNYGLDGSIQAYLIYALFITAFAVFIVWLSWKKFPHRIATIFA